jgi:hypothetical protein
MEIIQTSILEEYSESKEEYTFNYERSEIEQHFIDECDRLAEKTGETHFLFDTKLSNFIKKKKSINKEELCLLEEEAYHIGTEIDFGAMPSRFSYYDTETKLKDRYEKYAFATRFIESLHFVASEFNLGQEMEQSYILELREGEDMEKFIIRLQPNLFVKIIHIIDDFNTIYNGFFSKRKMFESIDKHSGNLSKILIRDSKIKNILS